MQGYIVNINKVKDEDLIVTILTPAYLYTTYRFYGARHSNINVGFKIDFETEITIKSDIPRLKDVLQISYPWILDYKKLYLWQKYLQLFYYHLKDVESLDSFYFELMEELAHKLTLQDPKRAIIENYIKLCDFEGRLDLDFECLLCETIITDKVTIIRGFKLTHIECSFGKKIELYKIKKLFCEKNSVALDDDECDYLFDIILQGL